jgi:hypothetical protein
LAKTSGEINLPMVDTQRIALGTEKLGKWFDIY